MAMKGMHFLKIDPVEWAKKHNLKIIHRTCKTCGEVLVLNKPCKSHGYVGFVSDICGCGDDMIGCYFKPFSGKKKTFWSNMTEKLSA